MIYLRDDDLYRVWTEKQPSIRENLDKTTDEHIIHLTKVDIDKISNLKMTSNGSFSTQAVEVIFDKSHPLFSGPLSKNPEEILSSIEIYLNFSTSVFNSSKEGNNVLHYLFALRQVWVTHPEFLKSVYIDTEFDDFLIRNPSLFPLVNQPITSLDLLNRVLDKIRENIYSLEDDFPFEVLLYHVNMEYTQVPISDVLIPQNEKPEKFSKLIDQFQEYNVNKPIKFRATDDDKTPLTVEILLERLQNLVEFVKNRSPYTGVPTDDEERKIYYDELKNALAWIVDLIKEETDLDKIQSALFDIATGGPHGHCGTH